MLYLNKKKVKPYTGSGFKSDHILTILKRDIWSLITFLRLEPTLCTQGLQFLSSIPLYPTLCVPTTQNTSCVLNTSGPSSMSSHRLFLLCLVYLTNFLLYSLSKHLLSDEWLSVRLTASPASRFNSFINTSDKHLPSP